MTEMVSAIMQLGTMLMIARSSTEYWAELEGMVARWYPMMILMGTESMTMWIHVQVRNLAQLLIQMDVRTVNWMTMQMESQMPMICVLTQHPEQLWIQMDAVLSN
jgi:hypothetical protein